MKLNRKNIIVYFLFFVVFLVFSFKRIMAASVATSVIVGNSAPSFTVNPFEVIASSTATPTNIGTSVTFQATGTDGNNENYYLAICKGNGITPNNNNPPTCSGGNWCISNSTASGSPTTCGYNAIQTDAESNPWYAFVCDYSPSSSCSTVSQGTGTSGSPFEVNHPPTFTSIGNTTPLNPGTTETWSTSVGTSDSDIGASDTVKLVVCKTTGVTPAELAMVVSLTLGAAVPV